MPVLSLLLISNYYFASHRSFTHKKIWLITLSWLSNVFGFPDPEPPIINSLYGRSGTCGQTGICSFM